MIAYEIQLRYVIRDKIQSEKKNFFRKKDFCWKKNFVRKNCLGFCLGLSVLKVSCVGQIYAYHH